MNLGRLILEAFAKMKDKQIGGLPVIDGATRNIPGNISIKDVRFLLLKPQLFSNFRELTVKDFIATVSAETNDIWRTVAPITCKQDATLGSVIDTLASRSVHGIYVVSSGENSKAVIGVITLRDVISCFIHEPPKFFDNYFGFAAQELLNQ